MPVTYYPAIIERGEEGFGVFFPDLPGCTSAGDTVQDAARNAEEALRGHLAAMADDGDEIPEPTQIDQVKADPEVAEAARMLVRADLPGKAVRLNISMDEGLVEAMDIRAKDRGMTRSAYLAELVRADLDANGRKVLAWPASKAAAVIPASSSEALAEQRRKTVDEYKKWAEEARADLARFTKRILTEEDFAAVTRFVQTVDAYMPVYMSGTMFRIMADSFEDVALMKAPSASANPVGKPSMFERVTGTGRVRGKD